MARIAKKKLLDTVTKHYLESGDFNGTAISSIKASDTERRRTIAEMVKSSKLSVEFGDEHPNAYVKAFPARSVSKQLAKLKKLDLQYACIYPSVRHLAKTVDPSKYDGKPYTLRLALGAGQLEYAAFDLTVLERYRNDPRYYYDCGDFAGSVCIKTEPYQSKAMRERDKVLLESFGFGHDKKVTQRVVIAFLRYLRALSPEHQQIWKAHELAGQFQPHPALVDVVVGNWRTNKSLFDGITEEMQIANEMVGRMNRPPLFKDDYSGENRPRKFGVLLRPTLEEFNSFVQLLEKMTSGNINYAFFQGEVSAERLEKRKDGTAVAKPKGSVSMLEEWFGGPAQFTPADDKSKEQMDRMFATFKKIVKLRQEPAHAVKEDVFDQEYFRQQRELVIDTYYAVRALRMVFGGHPKAAGIEVPKYLLEDRIWKE